MATFEIINDGFIIEPYKTQYGFQPIEGQNTIRNIDNEKVGVIVTISAPSKNDMTFYHEVENLVIDMYGQLAKESGLPSQETIDYWLQKLADDYAAS